MLLSRSSEQPYSSLFPSACILLPKGKARLLERATFVCQFAPSPGVLTIVTNVSAYHSVRYQIGEHSSGEQVVRWRHVSCINVETRVLGHYSL